jgi:hypothetical protein
MIRPPSKSVRTVLRQLWNGTSHKPRTFVAATKTLSEFTEIKRKQSYDISNWPVINWCQIIDEFALFFFLVFVYLKGGNEGASDFILSMKFLSSSLCAQLRCIRLVVLAGFDVQARSLVRIFSEYTDIMTLISAEPNLASESTAGEGSEDAPTDFGIRTSLKVNPGRGLRL